MSDDLPPPIRGGDEREGIVIGILVIVLIALLVFFYWHSVGGRGSDGKGVSRPRARAVREESTARFLETGAGRENGGRNGTDYGMIGARQHDPAAERRIFGVVDGPPVGGHGLGGHQVLSPSGPCG